MDTAIALLTQYSQTVQWTASLLGMGAALVVSLNLGARITGYAFVVFTLSSIAWMLFAMIEEETPLFTMNAVMFVINLIGIYRWLYIKAPKEEDPEGADHDTPSGLVAAE